MVKKKFKKNKNSSTGAGRGKSQNTGLWGNFSENHHGMISPASTLSLGIPGDMPHYRPFRPIKIVLRVTGNLTPAVIQVAVYDTTGKRINNTGPVVVGTNVSHLSLRYPSSGTNWSSDLRTTYTGPVFAIDNLCVRKDPGNNFSIVYSARTYYRYGQEEESESCPTYTSIEVPGGEPVIGPSLWTDLHRSESQNAIVNHQLRPNYHGSQDWRGCSVYRAHGGSSASHATSVPFPILGTGDSELRTTSLPSPSRRGEADVLIGRETLQAGRRDFGGLSRSAHNFRMSDLSDSFSRLSMADPP